VTDSEINDFLHALARYELAKMDYEAMQSAAAMYYPAVADEYQEARQEFRRACEWVRGR
jgi:hypothetical protein